MFVFSSGLIFADDIIIKLNNNGGPSSTSKAENDQQSGDVIMSAMSLLGVPYVFGGNTPKGLDCSGFIKFIFEKSMKVSLPRTSAAMGQTGQSIARDDIKPGDLVFFNTRGFANSHVGLYIGSNKFLHSPRTGKTVEVANMTNAYWSKRYNGARRIDKGSRTFSAKAVVREKDDDKVVVKKVSVQPVKKEQSAGAKSGKKSVVKKETASNKKVNKKDAKSVKQEKSKKVVVKKKS